MNIVPFVIIKENSENTSNAERKHKKVNERHQTIN